MFTKISSSVNLELLPMKGHYFFLNAALAPILPFLPIIGRQLGFSGTIIGVIYTILPVCGMLAKPLLGAVADRFRLKKVLFITFQIITLISFLPINYIPAYKTESKVHFTCDILTLQGMFDTSSSGNETTVNNSTNYNCLITKLIEEMGSDGTVSCKVNCPSIADLGWTEAAPGFTAFLPVNNVSVYNNIAHFPFTEVELNSMATRDKVCKAAVNNITTMCDMKCNSETINDILEVTPLQTIDNAVDQYQFWIFLILAIIGWVGMATIYTVGDAICFEMLNDNPSAYGNQRVWGSIGYGIFSILGGLMVDHFSKGNSLAKKDFSSVFYLMIVMVALDIVCSLRLKYEQKHTSPNIAKDVGKLLLNAKILVYLLWCTFMGVMIAMVWSFLFWHLEDLATKSSGCDMNVWIRTLQGLVNGIQCLGGELPFLFLSGWILRKLGHVHCMSIILLAVGVRFVLYSILIDPWWALPIELIQGITFGLFYATMTSYASIVAPPGTEATVQGLVGALFEGVGVSVGSLIGGIFIDKYGSSVTFEIFGIASFIACPIHFILQYLIEKISKSNVEEDIEKIKEKEIT